eukprot:UN25440
MKTHVDSNTFAVLGENNEIKFYGIQDIYESDCPILIGNCEIKPKILDMAWDGDRLLCLTEDEIIEIPLDMTSKKKKKRVT